MPKCPECNADLHGLDAYKHAVACFNLPDRGVDYILTNIKSFGDIERQSRIRTLLEYIKRE